MVITLIEWIDNYPHRISKSLGIQKRQDGINDQPLKLVFKWSIQETRIVNQGILDQ